MLRTAYEIGCERYGNLMEEALQERRNQKGSLERIGFSEKQVRQIIRDEKLSDRNLLPIVTNLVEAETDPKEFMKRYERFLYQSHFSPTGETVLNLADAGFNPLLHTEKTKEPEGFEHSSIFDKYPALKKAAVGTVLAAGLPLILSVPAQADFYDGQRAPALHQFDQRFSLGEHFNTTTMLKFFGEDKSYVDPALILKFYTENSKLTKYGCNVVGLIDDPLGLKEYWRLATVLQLERSKNKEGKWENFVSPSIFSTIKLGEKDFLTIDPRLIYKINLNGKDNFIYGCTIGFSKEGELRLGVDFSDSLNGKSEYGIVARMDIMDKEKNIPRYWWQAYFYKDRMAIGFRYNW